MEPETTSVTDPVATDQGDIEALATPTGEERPLATDAGEEAPQDAAGQPDEPQAQGPIPYERFKEVNDRLKAAEQQNMQMQQFLYQQSQQQQPPQGQQADPLHQFMEQQGIGSDVYLTKDDLTKFFGFIQQQNQRQVETAQMEQWLAARPEFSEVVTSPTGQLSEHLANAIKADPILAMQLRKQWDPVKAFYAAKAMASKSQQSPGASTRNVVDQIRSGQRVPQGISAATGGGGQVDQATSIAGMSQDQFQQWWQQKRGGQP